MLAKVFLTSSLDSTDSVFSGLECCQFVLVIAVFLSSMITITSDEVIHDWRLDVVICRFQMLSFVSQWPV